MVGDFISESGAIEHRYGGRFRSEPSALLDDIKRVHRDNHECYGSPRVHSQLQAEGRGASRGRIERLMRRYGVRAIMARPRWVRTTDSEHDLPIAPNLLDRNFTAAAPNRIWLADITYSAPRPEESGKRMFGMQ